MGEARQRVDLVHELAELAGAEELLDRRHDRADVDQRLRRDGLDVLRRHALADDPLHAGQADADLVLDQLADGADAPVGEVVLVVEAVAGLLLDEVQHVGDGGQDLAAAEHVLVLARQVELLVGEAEQLAEAGDLGPELAVELVAADPRQVVAAALEEGVAEVRLGRLDRRRLTGAGPLVDLDQRLVLGRGDVALLVPLALQEVEVGDEALEEAGGALLVVAEGAQQREDAEAPLAGHPGAGRDVLAGLLLDVELHPLTAVGVDRSLDELVLGQVAQAEALARLEDHAGAAHELADDDALGAVDDEGALLGLDGEVPHEDRLLLDLTRGAVHEPGPHEDGRRVGHVLLFALLDGELGRRPQVLVRRVELELELQRLGEVLDRADVAEGVGETLVEEPLEALALDGDQIGELQRLDKVGEGIALTGRRTNGHRSLLSGVSGGEGALIQGPS